MMNLTQCSTRQQKSGELEHSNLAYRKPTQEGKTVQNILAFTLKQEITTLVMDITKVV